MKYLSIPLLCACTSVYAQSATTQMPEGTADVDVGVLAAVVPRAEGRSDSRVIVVPTVSAQWSNGVYAMPGEVGMRLSRNPRWNFGPVLTYGPKPMRADGRGTRGGWGVEGGGFASYRVAHDIALSSHLLYGGGNDNQGLRFTASAGYGIDLTPHQALGVEIGFTAANANYMDSYFGVRGYHPGAGLKDLFASVRWNVELSARYGLATGVTATRLAGPAADSPLVQSSHNVTLYTHFVYHW